MTRKPISKAERDALFVSSDGKCEITGKDLEDGWHVDHIKPVAAGGENTILSRWHDGKRGADLTASPQKKRAPRYPYKGKMMTAREVAEMEHCAYSTAYRRVRAESVESLDDQAIIEKELRGEIPISGGAFRGCSQEQIEAMLTGDIKRFMKAS